MSDQSKSESDWEDWQLSALVLGELDPATARDLKRAASKDPELYAEIRALKKTMSRVQSAYKSEHGVGLSESERNQRLQLIFAKAADSKSSSDSTKTESQDLVEPAASPNQFQIRNARMMWLGLTAMTACLMVAVYWAIPKDTQQVAAVPTTTPNGSPTQAEATGERTDVSPDAAEGSENTNSDPGLAVETKEKQTDATSANSIAATDSSTERQSIEVPPSPKRTGSKETAPAQGLETSVAATDSPNGVDSQAGSEIEPEVSPNAGAPAINDLAREQILSQPSDSGAGLPANPGYGGEGIGLDAGMGLGAGSGAGISSGGYGGESKYSGGTPANANSASQYSLANGTDRGTSETNMSMRVFDVAIDPGEQYQSTRLELEILFPLQIREKILLDALGPNHPTLKKIQREIELVRKQVVAIRESERHAENQRIAEAEQAASERYAPIFENEFTLVDDEQLSTFAVDVDSASYAKSRQILLEKQRLPPVDAVRIEDFVNYFEYEYLGPEPGSGDPFGVNLDITACPWKKSHKLVRIGLQAEKLDNRDRPQANIVFLIDVSGSMNSDNKLPLVQESMRMLVRQLDKDDHVAIVVYAGAAGCVLESTPGNLQATIVKALDELKAGGSTNGGEGIQLAYDIAKQNFIKNGVNRVILCTDGDFNVGVTDTASLVDLVEENAKNEDVFLTVLGFGMGDTNDAMMEEISNRGNGVYGFVDNLREARRQMVEQLAGNLITVAKDVKIQVEFNPNRVKAYRLLGYENRLLAAEDFNDDTKDAGEIGAGHRVTAMYEIVPVGSQSDALTPRIDDLRYHKKTTVAEAEDLTGIEAEWMAVKLRYKEPNEEESDLMVYPLSGSASEFESADRDTRWAASMVEFAMQLRRSRYLGTSNWLGLLERAKSAAGVTPDPDRQECLDMIRRAARLNRK